MARARNIKPGFFKNEVLAEMPCEDRLLFVGLWTLADREGRLEDRPKRIKAELFAFDSFDVDPMLTRLQANGFLKRYEAGGTRFISITNFVKHQDPHYKEVASVIPPPPGEEDQITATNVTRTQRARILERDGYACVQCEAKETLCIDHILPASRGGDSSDENLQVLCTSCNAKKGNKLAGETKNVTRPPSPVLPAPPDLDLTSGQRRPDVSPTRSRVDPLIPSSLIPDSPLSDSGLLTPDPPNHNTSARPTAVRPAKPKADSSDAWEAYAEAYERRYGAPPVRNATVNGQLANFVKRVGIEEAPDIARFYVGLSTAWYVTKGHPVGLLLSDAEKLRTEWATGKTINGTSARRQEATAANPFLELLRDGTHG